MNAENEEDFTFFTAWGNNRRGISNKNNNNHANNNKLVTDVSITGDINNDNHTNIKEKKNVGISDDKMIFTISGDGTINSLGGSHVYGMKGLHVEHHSSLKGGLSLSQLKLKAGKKIEIPIQDIIKYVYQPELHQFQMKKRDGMKDMKPIIDTVSSQYVITSYILIEDDNMKNSLNEIILSSQEENGGVILSPGQLLIVTNKDREPTSGIARIPSNATVLLVYDGYQWVDIQALKAPIEVCLPSF